MRYIEHTPKIISMLVRPCFSSLVILGHLQFWRTLLARYLGNYLSREYKHEIYNTTIHQSGRPRLYDSQWFSAALDILTHTPSVLKTLNRNLNPVLCCSPKRKIIRENSSGMIEQLLFSYCRNNFLVYKHENCMLQDYNLQD